MQIYFLFTLWSCYYLMFFPYLCYIWLLYFDVKAVIAFVLLGFMFLSVCQCCLTFYGELSLILQSQSCSHVFIGKSNIHLQYF